MFSFRNLINNFFGNKEEKQISSDPFVCNIIEAIIDDYTDNLGNFVCSNHNKNTLRMLALRAPFYINVHFYPEGEHQPLPKCKYIADVQIYTSDDEIIEISEKDKQAIAVTIELSPTPSIQVMMHNFDYRRNPIEAVKKKFKPRTNSYTWKTP